MESLSDKIIQIIEQESKRFEVDAKAQSLELALKEFNSLVEKGVASKRGYNLLSIEDAQMQRINFYLKNR